MDWLQHFNTGKCLGGPDEALPKIGISFAKFADFQTKNLSNLHEFT